MGKVGKVKKREPTIHSRAHRRNASPPPKDLAVKAPAAADETEYKPWLHNAQNAGISKKKKSKQMTRQQKVRRERALERADANLDKLATKVDQSKARGRKVQARRAEWEELNGEAGVKGAEVGKDQGEGSDGEWEDEEKVELDVGMGEVKEDAKVGLETAEVKEVKKIALPMGEEDEEL